MRIIAGTYGGRKLESPAGNDVRPTSDKLRGSMFNSLASRMDIEGLHVLDLFCGSGALGLEAISRGAASCLFVDLAKSSLDLAKRNARSLECADRAEFLLKDAAKLGTKPENIPQAALFFCDPPYKKNLIAPCIEALVSGFWLEANAIGVLEMEKGPALSLPKGFELLSEKTYGDTTLTMVQFQP